MSDYSLGDLKAKLAELGIEPKKSLGQNFLVNKRSCDAIVGAARKFQPSRIVEIGPGLGALTDLLKPEEALLIELDSKLAQYWRDKGFKTLEEDALQTNWDALDLPENSVIMSNLPYQISSRLVIDRSISPLAVSGMVLMFQKEVAKRLLAKPDTDDYGLLTVLAGTFWGMEKLLEISSKDFFPPPQIASQVVVFRRKPLEGSFGTDFVEFVKLAFSQRRKFLVKNLSARYSQVHTKEALKKLGLDEKLRAEVLSPKNFQDLFLELRR
jgi:16S rRNA (adenine1518-N6/adenine1519-N6)-dimethyltransferase